MTFVMSNISSGVIASGVHVNSDEVVDVLSGGTALSTTVMLNGTFSVLSGGSAISTVVQQGGSEFVGSGGSATGNTLATFARQTVQGTVIGTNAAFAATQDVYGTASGGTFIDATQLVEAGGSALGITLSGFSETVSAGGYTSGTFLISSQEVVSAGATALATTATDLSEVLVASGGITSGTILSSGSELDSGTSVSALISSGGVLSVGGTASSLALASATIIAGGTLVVGSYGALSSGVTFSGSGGVLEIDGGMAAATISGFASTDKIDIPSLPYLVTDGLSYDASTGALQVSYINLDDGADYFAVSLRLSGDYTSGNFVLGPDSGSGTVVTVLPNGAVNGGNAMRDVFSGEISSGASVAAGEEMNVLSGGTAVDTVLNSPDGDGGGQLFVFGGGLAVDTAVGVGGVETISRGGTTIGDAFSPGGTQTVEGTAISTTGSLSVTQFVAGYVSATNLDGAEQIVEAGGTAIGTTVSGKPYDGDYGVIGSLETVNSGGVTSATFLISGIESDGGKAIGTVARDFSDLDIIAGGTAVSAVIDARSFENVSAGGVASGTILSSGGILSVGGTPSSFAVASATIIAGGTMMVGSYGAASAGVTFSGSGGVLEISGGAIATAISGFATTDEIDLATLPYTSTASASFDSVTDALTVSAGGSSVTLQLAGGDAGGGFVITPDSGYGIIVTGIETITVSTGEISSGLVIGPDERLDVLSGGEVIYTTVDAGGVVTVFGGGVTTGTVLSGGSEAVYGTAVSTLNEGGETVFSGGVTSGSLLLSGGGEFVSAGGSANATIAGVSGSGFSEPSTLDVFSGGTAVGALIQQAGSAYVADGGVSIATAVNSGGTESLGYGTYVYDGQAAVASDTVIDGGTVWVYGDGTLADGVSFNGSSGFLVVSTYALPTTVSGFGPTNTIDIGGLVVRNPTSITLNSSTDVLTVSAAGQFPYTIPLAGDFTSAVFGLNVSGQIDGTGLTVDSNPSVTNSIPCLALGTRIATDRGEMAVEHLIVGNLVLTAEGEAKPITWVGHRRVDCRRHPDPHKVWPVVIEANAFGAGTPHRALRLSPDHAVFAEGVFIPVRHLINGTTIRQIVLPAITYFHVELARHAVILAEGLPVESYLDTGDRNAFEDAAGTTVLHPAFASERGDITLVMDALGYAPLRITGPEVDAVKARLGSRRRYAS